VGLIERRPSGIWERGTKLIMENRVKRQSGGMSKAALEAINDWICSVQSSLSCSTDEIARNYALKICYPENLALKKLMLPF